MRLEIARDQNRQEAIYQLYMTAFPANERKPFSMMLEKCEEGSMEMLVIEDEKQQFAGLAIFVFYGDLALLDYFAIADEKRGAGIGSRALKLLQNYYEGKRFFLEIEDVKEPSENQEERLRRRAFYIRNHMQAMPIIVDLFGVVMEILTYECEITAEEYMQLYKGVFGKKRIEANVKILSGL